MKNVKLKIKNEDEDGKWGNEESPRSAGGSAPYAFGAERVQSLKIKVDPVRNFEDLRLNTTYCAEEHPEGWTPNGEGNVKGPMSKVQGNLNVHMTRWRLSGGTALCRVTDAIVWDRRGKALSRQTLPAQSKACGAGGRGACRCLRGIFAAFCGVLQHFAAFCGVVRLFAGILEIFFLGRY